MDIANLRAFAAVARGQSFSAAATQLHLTQPAISKRIAVLETELDAPLFDRLGRRIELTEAGRALLAHLPEIEQSLRQAEQAVRDINGDVSGPLRIATSHHIGLHRLPPVLSAFQRSYPLVQLAIEFLDSEQAYERLRVGDIELAVVTLAPGDVTHLQSEAIWTDALCVMISKTHPLAGRRRISIEELATYPAVLPGLDTFTGQIVHQHFESVGAALQLSMATNYLETLRMMAVVGLGWTVLPESMAGPDLQTLRVDGTVLSRTLGLVRHQERSLSRSANAFLTLLRQSGKPSLPETHSR
ncbi:LysR family transcriptional regulator [Congregibacter sp.]|uniref:LysR family transcriptional regulator n=1 Tax=Congregibacter sp. TaxID=2744308 RepID=UPI003F6C6135